MKIDIETTLIFQLNLTKLSQTNQIKSKQILNQYHRVLGLLRGLTASLDVSQSYLEVMTPYARKALADKYIKHKADMGSALLEKQGGGSAVSITKVLFCDVGGIFAYSTLPSPSLSCPLPAVLCYTLTQHSLPCLALPTPPFFPTLRNSSVSCLTQPFSYPTFANAAFNTHFSDALHIT